MDDELTWKTWDRLPGGWTSQQAQSWLVNSIEFYGSRLSDAEPWTAQWFIDIRSAMRDVASSAEHKPVITPSEDSKRVILICKGHHEAPDTMTALESFVQSWCMIPPQYVTRGIIIDFLLKAVREVLDKKTIVALIRDVFKYRDPVYHDDLLSGLIGVLGIVQVQAEDGTTLVNLDPAPR